MAATNLPDNALVRLLIRVHIHRSAIAFMSRTGGHG
jgi:hypothetical protein